MSKLGFLDQWVFWSSSLYRHAKSSILVNGKKLPAFPIQRSVCQGCPLAPYLYLLFLNVLTHMFNDASFGIDGLTLLDGSVIKISYFADDTTLFLRGDPTNLEKALQIIELFCSAPGAKLNSHKSCALWVSFKPRTWTWGLDKGLLWLSEG